jgi:hypothetical protein
MAFAKTLEQAEPQRTSRHAELRLCEFRVFQDPSGQTIFQIDTYGSNERANPDKISQSLQFDLASARELIGALQTAFPDLDKVNGPRK